MHQAISRSVSWAGHRYSRNGAVVLGLYGDLKHCFPESKVCLILALLADADDEQLLGANMNTLKKNTETLIDACKEVGLEINAEKTKYMLVSRHQNSGL
jgi:hypothetical protein